MCLLLPLRIAGQQYNFRHYDIADGLNDNAIYSTIQDDDGFLWISSEKGINRFDGKHFVNYQIDDQVFNIIKDNNGGIWAGIIGKGLYQYDKKQDSFIPVIKDTSRAIYSLTVDKSNRLWFCLDGSLYSYLPSAKTLRMVYAGNGAQKHIRGLNCVDDQVWFTEDPYIMCYDQLSGKFTQYNMFEHSPPDIQQEINRIFYDGYHNLVLATRRSGLKIFDLKTKIYRDIPLSKLIISTRALVQISKEEFWIGTSSGIYIYNIVSGKVTHLKKDYANNGLNDDAVYSLYKDKEGGIWVGTYWGGINYFHPVYSQFESYAVNGSANAIGGNLVRNITEDSKGNIWISTEDNGLSKLDPKTSLFKNFSPDSDKGSINAKNIQSLHIEDSRLWIGTFYDGIYIMDMPSEKIISNISKKSQPEIILASHIEGLRDDIYIGSYINLCRYNNSSKTFRAIAFSPHMEIITFFHGDSKGNLWIPTWKGLYRYNPAINADTAFKYNITLPGNSFFLDTRLNTVFEDSKGRLWLGSHEHGLGVLDFQQRKLLVIDKNNGMPHHQIRRIVEDDYGDFWVSTKYGLVQLNSSAEIQRVFHQSDGLISSQFNHHSGFKAHDGKLYFGTTKGLLAFHPGNIFKTSFTPSLIFTQLKVNNQIIFSKSHGEIIRRPISQSDTILLKYDQSEILLEFAALSYITPDLTHYSYFLEGFSKKWSTPQTESQAHFTNLAPGKYTLKVRAYSKSFSGTPESNITLIVSPPFWKTWWAYLLYTFFIICLTCFVLKQYKQSINKKKESELFQKQIEFYTNIAHEIKTPLTLIKGPLELIKEKKEILPLIEQEIGIISRNEIILDNLVRQLLDFKKIEAAQFQLQFSRVNITRLLKQEFERFSAFAKNRNLDFTINLQKDDISILGDESSLQKIFSNLFSNACKYAQKKIRVDFTVNEKKEVIIHFISDGKTIAPEMREKIFDAFIRASDNSYIDGTGIGLYIASSLTQLHGGTLSLHITPENYNDFILVIPVEKTAV